MSPALALILIVLVLLGGAALWVVVREARDNGTSGREGAGFVLELENGFRVYHAGDTAVFGDMALIRQLFAPDLAMLPIGGHYTMDPAGAALAAELLGVRDVLPIHWGTFPILGGTPAALEAAIRARGGKAVVHHWKPGDTVS